MVFYTGQRTRQAENNLISMGFIYASDDLLTSHSQLRSLALRMAMIPAKRENRGLGMRGTMCFTRAKTVWKWGCAYWLSAHTVNPLGCSHMKFIWNVCLHVDLLPTFPGRKMGPVCANHVWKNEGWTNAARITLPSKVCPLRKWQMHNQKHAQKWFSDIMPAIYQVKGTKASMENSIWYSNGMTIAS